MLGRKEIGMEWARSQIEPFADGTLRGEQRARMRAVLRGAPEIALEVDRARAVRAALRRMGLHRPPGGLRRRLLAIAWRRPFAWRTLMAPAAVGVAAALTIALIALWGTQPRPAAEPRLAAQEDVEQAIDEFNIAMHYLRVSTERSREQMSDAVRLGARLAMTTSHEAMRKPFLDDRNERNGE